MLIRGEIQEKLALFMLWIAWNCLEKLLTDSYSSFTCAIDLGILNYSVQCELFSKNWILNDFLHSSHEIEAITNFAFFISIFGYKGILNSTV